MLLARYLERDYYTSSLEQRQAFESLLEKSDPEILDYILGKSLSDRAVTASCVTVSLIVPWLLPVAPHVIALLSAVSCGISWLACRRSGLVRPRYRIVRARLTAEDQWQLSDHWRSDWPATLVAATRVTPFLICLHWNSEFGRRQVLLFRWNAANKVGVADWRRLAIRLRFLTPAESGVSLGSLEPPIHSRGA